MSEPIICFGQQPCGFFPKRFLYAKILTARRLQKEIGGEIVFFFHDSDHDPRETSTLLRERKTGREDALNFEFANKVQKQFSPLYVKRVLPEWQTKTARQLPNYVAPDLVEHFKAIAASNVAEFCRHMYARMGLLEGIRVERSSDPAFRKRAMSACGRAPGGLMKRFSMRSVVSTNFRILRARAMASFSSRATAT